MKTLRRIRTCRGHLDGPLGAVLLNGLIAAGRVILDEDGVRLTREGLEFFENFGVELGLGNESRGAFCRLCRGGSRAQPHLAGIVGIALARRCLDLGWVERTPGEQALTLTEIGRHELGEIFGLSVDQLSR